ncbi:MAG TPA: NAD-dependent epimerase/dehydratase family protein [Alphaproteobacteria bacterium]|jgi:nucleoside-diphosphate-sugar epimerase
MNGSSRKRVVVCGATGFIGRNLVEALARTGNAEVVAVHHKRPTYALPSVRWIAADLTREEGAGAAVTGADVVIQAAATTSGAKDIVERPYIHTTDNAVMNSLLLRACHEAGVGQFVFFSCSVMYQPSPTPVRESDLDLRQPLHPRYFAAGWTKLYIERMCELYAGFGRTRCAVLRHSNIYGPHDKFDLEKSHMLGATVTKAMTARDGGALKVWGTGEEARDLLHVADLVRCVELVIERQKAPFALYNVGAGRAVKVRDVVERVIAASGRRLAIEHDLAQPTIPVSLALDCSRIAAEIGWRPEIDLDRGLAETVAWWRANPPAATASR